MDSLVLSPSKPRTSERRRRPLTQDMTLASLSTESSVILNKLLEPGNTRDPLSFLNKDVNTSRSSKPPFKDGKLMPGTLLTPGPSFLTDVSSSEDMPQYNARLDSGATITMGVAAAPLARSTSLDERTAFLDGLTELSRGPAAVYAIHVHELQQIAESAVKFGFHVGIVPPKTGSGEGLLILGRDFGAVEDLHARLSGDEVLHQSSIRAMAGGAVAGAVATFTGLALA